MIDVVLEDDSVQLRPVTDEDLELLMAWRSHPDVYRHFYRQDGPLVWETHYQFWKTRQDRIDWIIYFDDGNQKRKVGSVNVKMVSSDCPEVGILIGEITLMSKGIGTRSVSLVVQWLKTRGFARVRANVFKENMPSQRLFTTLGFEQRGEVHDGAEWVYEKLLN